MIARFGLKGLKSAFMDRGARGSGHFRFGSPSFQCNDDLALKPVIYTPI